MLCLPDLRICARPRAAASVPCVCAVHTDQPGLLAHAVTGHIWKNWKERYLGVVVLVGGWGWVVVWWVVGVGVGFSVWRRADGLYPPRDRSGFCVFVLALRGGCSRHPTRHPSTLSSSISTSGHQSRHATSGHQSRHVRSSTSWPTEPLRSSPESPLRRRRHGSHHGTPH